MISTFGLHSFRRESRIVHLGESREILGDAGTFFGGQTRKGLGIEEAFSVTVNISVLHIQC
jgi:hypothetical protein